MIKKLDIYILRKFLGTFVFAIGLISIVIIVFDISEKLDSFIKKHVPVHAIIFDYYCNFVPYLVNLFSPLFTFISVVFFTSRLAARSEIIAILSSGVSFRRLLYPYIVGSFMIASLSLYLNHVVIPNANKTRLAFENMYTRDKFMNVSKNIHKQISPGVYIYMLGFNVDMNQATKFSLEKMVGQELRYKLTAETATWDSVKKDWKLFNYYTRTIAPDGTESLVSGMYKDTVLGFYPTEFKQRVDNVQAMNYKELNEYIDKERMEGSTNLMFYEVEKDQRTAFPFATFILTFIGVSLSSRKVRGGTGLHVGIGLLIAFSFILFMQVSTTFAEGGIISPFVSVWIPNLLYGVLAFFLLRTAPK
jgi:lipopolysaccharide export system permease protein